MAFSSYIKVIITFGSASGSKLNVQKNPKILLLVEDVEVKLHKFQPSKNILTITTKEKEQNNELLLYS